MKEKNSLRGKKSRAAGRRFELKARKDLESKGWIVDKWTNNIDLDNGKLIPAKRKFNPYMKILGIGTGFPDFIALKKKGNCYEVMGVEVKANGWLDRNEREKCRWLLQNEIFSKVLVAKKGQRRGDIEYADFSQEHDKA
jgi:hypothetical protein